MDINDKLQQVTQAIENQLDTVIEEIDCLNIADLEELRKKRIKQMKERELKLLEWKHNGHGVYDEIPEEKEFFNVIKKSEHVIMHFFTNSNERCKIVDKHLKILAPKHMETLFTKINAEKCPFLCDRLKIKVLPAILCIKSGVAIDKIIGFTTIGNKDDFTTEDMEWRLAQNEIIEYEGDLSILPSEQVKSSKHGKPHGKIRNGIYNGADDDLYIDQQATVEKPTQSYELTAEEEAELEM